MEKFLVVLGKFRDAIVLILFFGAILLVPARMYAQQFIETTVGERLVTLEEQITELKESNLEAKGDLETLQKLLEQQFSLMKFLASRERGDE
jgi:uncharacterized protein YpuA (DUF1002 family)